MSDFHTSGAVPLISNAYIKREFENTLYRNAVTRRWSILLGPRQHGKTSSLIRLRRKLQDEGLTCINISLQAMPPPETYEDILRWFANEVAKELELQLDNLVGYEARQLNIWLERAIPDNNESVIILIDEASAIQNEEWRNAFFGQIRTIANEIATAEPTDIAARLCFIFAGSFRPENLVNNVNSPFNVCSRIETEDLTLDQANRLYRQVSETDNSELVEKIYGIVGGQPYLLQFVFLRLQDVDETEKISYSDSVIDLLRSDVDGHFEGVFTRILTESGLTDLVADMVRDGSIPNDPANPDYKYLQTLGVAIRVETNLEFRNNLYRDFATNSVQITPSTPRAGISPPVATSEDTYIFMVEPRLREIAYKMELGAVRCCRSGNFRLALAGFGAALEAVLMDWLSSRPALDLATAVTAAQAQTPPLTFGRRETSTDATTFTLFNLMKVGRLVNPGFKPIDLPEALREWRNLIHPGKVINDYLPEEELVHEAYAAIGLLGQVKRDVANII